MRNHQPLVAEDGNSGNRVHALRVQETHVLGYIMNVGLVSSQMSRVERSARRWYLRRWDLASDRGRLSRNQLRCLRCGSRFHRAEVHEPEGESSHAQKYQNLKLTAVQVVLQRHRYVRCY